MIRFNAMQTSEYVSNCAPDHWEVSLGNWRKIGKCYYYSSTPSSR
jgi:hypothetical protein